MGYAYQRMSVPPRRGRLVYIMVAQRRADLFNSKLFSSEDRSFSYIPSSNQNPNRLIPFFAASHSFCNISIHSSHELSHGRFLLFQNHTVYICLLLPLMLFGFVARNINPSWPIITIHDQYEKSTSEENWSYLLSVKTMSCFL